MSDRVWLASRSERIKTLLRLGVCNLARVGLYRLASRLGLWRAICPLGDSWAGPMFSAPDEKQRTPIALSKDQQADLLSEATEVTKGKVRLFSGPTIEIGNPPCWHASPYAVHLADAPLEHWSVARASCDIKEIWEASRFTWAPLLARAWRQSGDSIYISTLDEWTTDWVQANPPNAGLNWACGQEASFRLLHVLLSAELVSATATPTPSLIRFVQEHVDRIAATTSYAIGQDNNHGTSEAIGLFVGGGWLVAHGHEAGRRYRERGRRMLDERVKRLIMRDGGFSQYSVNYHRLLLDSLSIAEWWRRRLGEPSFSAEVIELARRATDWLYQMVDETCGRAPNIGANDGARLLALSTTPYTDYRSSVQLASALFLNERAYDDELANEPLLWLEIDLPASKRKPRESRLFGDSGWLTLHAENRRSWACIRYPRYRFRPGHSDALHVDLWHDGKNLLCDAGSYAYAASEPWQSYFPGVAAHNTIGFGDRDQMPRVSRFLYGGWLKASAMTEIELQDGAVIWTGEYTDSRGASHRRTVHASDAVWKIVDEVDGGHEEAVLRWRLSPGDYSLDGTECSGNGIRIHVVGVDSDQMTLTVGWYSLLYREMNELPVLEVRLGAGASKVITEVHLPGTDK